MLTSKSRTTFSMMFGLVSTGQDSKNDNVAISKAVDSNSNPPDKGFRVRQEIQKSTADLSTAEEVYYLYCPPATNNRDEGVLFTEKAFHSCFISTTEDPIIEIERTSYRYHRTDDSIGDLIPILCPGNKRTPLKNFVTGLEDAVHNISPATFISSRDKSTTGLTHLASECN